LSLFSCPAMFFALHSQPGFVHSPAARSTSSSWESGVMLSRTLLALLAAALLAATAAAQTVISVNPISQSGPNPDNGAPLPSSSVAGVVPVSNWNNIQGNGTFASLVNNTGVATAATLSVAGSTNNWSVTGVPATGDGSMMQGYLDNSP